MNEPEYAGFWVRTGAALIDSILVVLITLPLLTLIYGKEYWTGSGMFYGFFDLLLGYVFPAVACIAFWMYKSATPGKLLTKIKIVDSQTLGKPTTGQLIGRYFAYFVSMFPMLLGIIWVGFDKRKRGWHDMLAGTLVVMSDSVEPVVQEKQAKLAL